MCFTNIRRTLLWSLLLGALAVPAHAAKLKLQGGVGVVDSGEVGVNVILEIEDVDTVTGVNAARWTIGFDSSLGFDRVVYNTDFFGSGWAQGGANDEDASDQLLAGDYTNFTASTPVVAGNEYVLATYYFNSTTAGVTNIVFDSNSPNHVIDGTTFLPIIANAASNQIGFGTAPIGSFENSTVEFVELFVAANDTYTIEEDATTEPIAVTGNDKNYNAAGEEISRTITIDSVSVVSPPNSATVAINGTNIDFTPAADFNGEVTFTYTASVDATDAGGPADLQSTATVTVTVNAVNDAPVNTVPEAPTDVLEDVAKDITGFSIADIDAGNGDLTTTLSAVNGTITVVATGSATITTNGTSSVQIEGTLAEINAALATVTYQTTLDYFGAETITMVTNDNGNTGSGGPLTDTSTVEFTVAPVNDVPVFTVGANLVTDEGSDPVSVPNWATIVTKGPATLDNEDEQTLTFEITNVTNASIFETTPAISEAGALTYTITDVYASKTPTVSTVTVRLKDDGGVLNGGVDTSATQDFTITIDPVNDAPVIDPSKISVDPVVIVAKDDNTEAVTVTVAEGAFIDEEDGDISNTASFKWQRSIDGGAWSDLSGASVATATLTATDRVAALPTEFTYYAVRCLISVTDSGEDGGVNPITVTYGDETNELNSTVQVGNQPPVIVEADTTPAADEQNALPVDEGSTLNFTARFTDTPNAGTTGDDGIKSIVWQVMKKTATDLSFSEVVELNVTENYTPAAGDSRASAFTFSPDQDFQVHAGDTEYKLIVTGTDGNNVPNSREWYISVNDVNSRPVIGNTTVTITRTGTSVGGNVGINDTVAADITFGGSDADAEDNVNDGTLKALVEWSINGSVVETDEVFVGLVPGSRAPANDAELNTAFVKGDVITVKVFAIDSTYQGMVRAEDSSTSEGFATTDALTVFNTAPVEDTTITAPFAATEGANATYTNAELIAGLIDSDNDDLTVNSATVPNSKGNTTVAANGAVTYTATKADFEMLAVGETEDVVMTLNVTDGDAVREGVVARTVTVQVTGVNDAPVIASARITGNVSLSDVDNLTTLTATVDADDIDSDDTAASLIYTYVWGTKRKGDADYTDAAPEVVTGPAPSTFDVTGSAKGDKFRCVITVADQHGLEDDITKTATLGSPDWFPSVDISSLVETFVDGTYQVTLVGDAGTTVTVTADADLADPEIKPADYLASSWNTSVKGFKAGETVTATAVKRFVDGSFVNETLSSTLAPVAVENYDDASLTPNVPTVVVPVDNTATFEFALDSASGYKYVLTKDGKALESGTFTQQADVDGAVDSSADVTFERYLVAVGTYVLNITAFNPSSESLVTEFTAEVSSDAVEVPNLGDVTAVAGMTPGTDTQADPQVIGTASNDSSSFPVNFSWTSVTGAQQYGIYVMTASGNTVLNERVGTATNYSANLSSGIYQWYVIAWNAKGYSQWSEAKWFQVNSPDDSQNQPLAAIDIASASLTTDGTLTIELTREYTGEMLQVFVYSDDYVVNSYFEVTTGATSVTISNVKLNGYTGNVNISVQAVKGDKATGWSADTVVTVGGNL